MGKHLKTRVIEGLESTMATFEALPKGSTPHKRGVHYFRADIGVDALWGAMDEEKEGQKYKKRIVVRPSRFRDGLFELYTYHFPTQWSAACVANREMIKEAQRRAHALEKDAGPEGLEWRIRFFAHYFKVFKGGEKPAEGMKRYSRFFQYVYVAIYRELQREAKGEIEAFQRMKENEVDIEEISFEPVDWRPRMRSFSSPLRRAYNSLENRDLQPPDLQHIIFHRKIPRTTEEFAHVKKKQYLCTGFLISD